MEQRGRLTAARGGGMEEETVHAFQPQEVRAILQETRSTLERLIVLLFLTTGVRIGGLTRLHVPSRNQTRKKRVCRSSQRGGDVPCTLRTVEKNGRIHTVFLTPACRALIAEYHRSTTGLPEGPGFLFPMGGTECGCRSLPHIFRAPAHPAPPCPPASSGSSVKRCSDVPGCADRTPIRMPSGRGPSGGWTEGRRRTATLSST